MPLIEERLAVRLAVDAEQSDGFVYNDFLNDRDFAEESRTNLRLGIRFDPSDQFSAILKLTRLDSEDYPLVTGVDGARFPDDRVTSIEVDPSEEIDFEAGNLRLTYTLNNSLRLESETTYSEGDSFSEFETASIEQTADSFEQQIKLLYESEALKAVFGFFYAEDKTDGVTLATLFGGTVSAEFLNQATTENYAVFAELEYRLRQNLTLIVGGRYDRETLDSIQSTAFSAVLPSSSSATDADYDAFLPKLGVVRNLTENVSLGFTVQRGYRAGGAGINTFTGQPYEYAPEFTWNYEISFRSLWAEERVTINANAFYTDWSDQQVAILGPSNDSLDLTVENAGSSRVWGAELEVSARPTSSSDMFLTLGYADTEFDDFISGGQQLAGNEFPSNPEFTAAFGATYYFLENFFVTADASYTDDAFSEVQNLRDRRDDSRFLVNARIGYETDRWSIVAYVDNLFDKDYIATAFQGRDGPVDVGDPRTYGVIAQYQF
ncbi:MAG: TonB-dependent receptor [Pseudomonadota bacterium]